jgi:hypothetical protein
MRLFGLMGIISLLLAAGGCGSAVDETTLDSGPTFARDIAPIIHSNCTPCHRPGTAAPFNLITYRDVSKRSKMIKYVTGKRYMPPWPANPSYRSFIGEKFLTDDQIKLIAQWHDAGAPRGNPDLEPNTPSYPIAGFLGEPDLQLPVEPFLVQGNNRDKFMMVKVPYELPSDTFVRVAEFVPGGATLVHHMNGHLIKYAKGAKSNVFGGARLVDTEAFTDPEAFEKLDLRNDDGTFPYLKPLVCNYLPGVEAAVYPEGIGGFTLPAKGVFLINDMHYAPSSVEAWDSSYINLFFSPIPPERPTLELQMGTLGVSEIKPPLVIPPDTVMTFITEAQVNEDLSLVTLNPHMHLLGKEMIAFAITPSRDTIPLIHIPKWDFHWQYYYTFEHLLHIPKGSIIHVEATFDNTRQNPDNPNDPPRIVAERDGSMRTTDEMLQFIITFLPYEPGDEHISLRASL